VTSDLKDYNKINRRAAERNYPQISRMTQIWVWIQISNQAQMANLQEKQECIFISKLKVYNSCNSGSKIMCVFVSNTGWLGRLPKPANLLLIFSSLVKSSHL